VTASGTSTRKEIAVNTIVKAAAVQISPVLYSRQGTVEKVVKKIGELGEQGVQFVTFPETLVPYYPYFSFVQPPFLMGKEYQRLLEESVTVPSAETHAIAEAALRSDSPDRECWQHTYSPLVRRRVPCVAPRCEP